MPILVTNDDGVDAPGMAALVAALRPAHQIAVVAPEIERSAVGHAITLTDPIKVRRLRRERGTWGWAVKGTPADCVKLAFWKLLADRQPHLVVSGINRGPNAGLNLLYSGTVSAATEAALLGLTGLAFSLDSYDLEADYGPAAKLALDLIDLVLARSLKPGLALNVNFPDRPDLSLNRCRLTRQSLARPMEEFVERRDPRGNLYFWQAGESIKEPDQRPGPDLTDQEALFQGYTSITPVQFDLTNHQALAELGPDLGLDQS